MLLSVMRGWFLFRVLKHFPAILALVTRYSPVLQGDNRWACHVLEINRIQQGLSGIIRQEVNTDARLV